MKIQVKPDRHKSVDRTLKKYLNSLSGQSSVYILYLLKWSGTNIGTNLNNGGYYIFTKISWNNYIIGSSFYNLLY